MAKWSLAAILVALGGIGTLPALACGGHAAVGAAVAPQGAQQNSWQDRLAGRALILSERRVMGNETITARRTLSLCPDGVVLLHESSSSAARTDGSQSQSQAQSTRTGRWRVEGDTLIVDVDGQIERHTLTMPAGDMAIDGKTVEYGATDCR